MDFSFSGVGLDSTSLLLPVVGLGVGVGVLFLIRHVFFSVGDELLYKYLLEV